MQDITHPDDQAENAALFERIAETGAPSIIEHRYLRPDGSVIWVQNSVSVVHDASGRPLGTLAATIDISEQKRAEAQITLLAEDSRSRREEREALLRALPVGVFIAHNAQGTQITTNPAGAAILGITASANASKTGPTGNALPFRVLKDGIEVPGDQLPMQRASQTGQPVMGEEVDVQFADGKVTNLYEYAVPLRDRTGTVRGCIGVFVDITARKQAELRQKLLLNELNHRVKNTLAIVQSIAAQTLREIPEPRAFKQAFSARLMTLSRAHNLLTRTAWQGAPLGDVVAAALAPFRTDNHSQFHVQGPTVLLEPNSAVTLSLAIHELATNAAKYGALSRLAGRVQIAWSITDSSTPGGKPLVEFNWEERGGPIVRPPEHRGFGTRLVEASTEQLGGRITLDYRPEGFECRFVLPLPDIPATEVLPPP
jgi:PAS domain S-box-containing protein